MRKLLPLVLLLGGLRAEAAPAPTLTVPFERYRLGNGLTVILHEDHRLPQVVVNLWFRVGSKDERPGRTGFAHLFEHLMFMGTRAVPNGKFDEIMESSGGSNNATTSEDKTNYFETGPSHLLETFLWLEADRLATLPDDMTKQKVDLQREVVKNERRQRVENRPYGKVELVLPALLFPKGHPYQHPVIGSHADLNAASVDDVKAFFRANYVPSNASLVVAGDFKPEEAKKLVEKYFAPLARAPEPFHAVPPPVRLPKPVRATLTDAVELERVTLAWHSPEQLGPGDAECELLAAVLGGGKSSRLQRALVYEQKLAQEVEVQQGQQRYGGVFEIVATAQPGVRADKLEQAIDAELKRLAKEPPTAREVERARAYTQTRHLQHIESLFEIADGLNEYEFLRGDPGAMARTLLARYQHLGPSDLAWQAHAVLSQPRATIVVVPAKSAKAQSAKPVARKEVPRVQ